MKYLIFVCASILFFTGCKKHSVGDSIIVRNYGAYAVFINSGPSDIPVECLAEKNAKTYRVWEDVTLLAGDTLTLTPNKFYNDSHLDSLSNFDGYKICVEYWENISEHKIGWKCQQ